MPSSAALQIDGLSKDFGRDRSVHAVDDLTLHADPGEFVVLLGPSGCGKTTLLRCLAGLERPDRGRIRFGDRLMSDADGGVFVPTYRRNLGMVFQSYSLWPHMTVAKNVEYPLKTRGERDADVRRRAVDEALALVECSDLGGRLPSQLSGGQQQRIALARAIVDKPAFIMFDEPLSNLDFRLRAQLRAELRELHRRIGFTGVYVTHDQVEAFQLGTVVAVLNQGRIEQLGSSRDIFTKPASAFVARFLGIENRLAGIFEGGALVTDVGRLTGPLTEGMEEGAEYEVFVRASSLTPDADSSSRDRSLVVLDPGVMVDSLYSGDSTECVLTVGNTRIAFEVPLGRESLEPDAKVVLAFSAADAYVYRTQPSAAMS